MPSEGWKLGGLVLAVAAVIACGGGAATPDAGDDRSKAVEAARTMAKPETLLPSRPEVLAQAQTLEAFAAKEGKTQAARELHELAGNLFERVFRRDGKDQDGKEALAAYTAAAADLGLEGACADGLRGARLAGDVARDAETTYGELYRLQRRLTAIATGDAGAPAVASACAAEVDAALGELAAFRPAPRVLSAIDAALAAQGLLAGTVDAGRALDPAKVLRVEQWPGRDAARVVITLNHAAPYRTGDEASSGGRGARTFVELDGVELGSAGRASESSGVVRRVGVEATSSGSRVAIEIDGGQAYRHVFTLLEPYRIVIDVARRPPGATATRRAVERIVLDPGHGGNDAGATGPTGVKEKDVTLDVAKRAAKALGDAGLKAYLTRDDDRYVTLEERTARANQLGADLFVSIHCNAAENHARRGVETYVLDTTKDDIAARVASRENATTEQATAELASILASMRLADQASHSTRLAELLQRSAIASLKPTYPDTLDGGVHPAGFYVLVGARMPAVLFETSYVSNPTEETRLASDDYKNLLVDALVNAIRAYREGR